MRRAPHNRTGFAGEARRGESVANQELIEEARKRWTKHLRRMESMSPPERAMREELERDARYGLAVLDALEHSERKRERLEQRVAELERGGLWYAEIICEGMAGRPSADDTARFVNTLRRKETP